MKGSWNSLSCLLIIILACGLVLVSTAAYSGGGPSRVPFSNGTLTLPLSLWSSPRVNFTVNKTPAFNFSTLNESLHIATVEFSHVFEIRSISNLFDTRDQTNLTQRLKNPAQVQYLSNTSLFDTSLWNAQYGETNDTRTVLYSGELQNGAKLTMQFLVNNASDAYIPIPFNNNSCDYERQWGYCSCEETHLLPKETMKINLGVKNWTFTNSTPALPGRWLVFKVLITCPIDIDYYSRLNTSSGVFTSSGVCYVRNHTLTLRNGILFPMTFFSNAIVDGVSLPSIHVVFDITQYTVLQNGEVLFPAYIIFGEFKKELFYDPDFSVLLSGGENDISEASNGAGDGGGGVGSTGTIVSDGGKLSSGAIAGVVVGVVIGTIIIIVLLVAAGVGLAVLRIKRQRARTARV